MGVLRIVHGYGDYPNVRRVVTNRLGEACGATDVDGTRQKWMETDLGVVLDYGVV